MYVPPWIASLAWPLLDSNPAQVLIAGLGDSRAILIGPETTSSIQILTAPHNPADPTERARILKSGGQVPVFPGGPSLHPNPQTPSPEPQALNPKQVGVFPGEPSVKDTGQGRVFVAGTDYPGLATARAFGDAIAKSVGVSAEPSCVGVSTLGRAQALIIATGAS